MAKTGSSGNNLNKGSARSVGQILPEERQRMIAEVAYFRAAQRGFNGGDPVDDWLVAESEINRRLSSRHSLK
ncbi:MAG: DUF2934 domain-containing protein [Sulfuricaulis sp.]